MHDRTAVLGALSEELYARMRGLQTEERFFSALLEGEMPRWFSGMRHPTQEEDEKGRIDAFVRTDLGEAPFQIKSSYEGARQKMNLYYKRGIILQTILSGQSDRIIRQDAIRLVENWRQRRLQRMPRWRPQWMPVLNYSHR